MQPTGSPWREQTQQLTLTQAIAFLKFRLVCNGMGFVAQSAPIDLLPYREAMAPTQGCLGEASGYWCSGRFACWGGGMSL